MGVVLRTFDRNNRWRWVVSFRLQPLYTHGKNLAASHWPEGWWAPTAALDASKRVNAGKLPTCIIVTILTELSRWVSLTRNTTLTFYVPHLVLWPEPSPFPLFPSPSFHTWIYTETGRRVTQPTHSFTHTPHPLLSIYPIPLSPPTTLPLGLVFFVTHFFSFCPSRALIPPCILPQRGWRLGFLGATMGNERRWLGKERCFFFCLLRMKTKITDKKKHKGG